MSTELPYELQSILESVFTSAYPDPANHTNVTSATLKSIAALHPAQVFVGSSLGTLSVFTGANERFSALQQDLISLSQARKSIDRIALLPSVGKALILGEGLLTFHNIANFQVVSAGSAAPVVGSGNTVKGVVTFAVDDYMTEGQDAVNIAILKRKTVALYRVTRTGVDTLRVRFGFIHGNVESDKPF